MAKKEPKKVIAVELGDAPFPVAIWFNQFSVRENSEGKIVYFGLDSDQGLAATFSVFLEPDCIENSRSSILNFLDKVGGTPDDAAPEWRGPLEPKSTPSANMILMMATNDIAEIRLGVYAHGIAIDKMRAKEEVTTIRANPVALLHCKKGLIRHLITAIYT